MNGFTLVFDVLLIVVMMSALSWRESRWSRPATVRRLEAQRPEARRPREASRRAKAA